LRYIPVNSASQRLPPIERRWISGGGYRFHYRVAGVDDARAIPLVLVHGLGVSSAYWSRTHALLASTHRVYAPDLPGFGRSTKPRRLLGISGLAQALMAWMVALGIDRAHLIGHSMGGQVVAECAGEFPTSVASVTLVGSTIGAHGAHAPRHAIRLMQDGARERGALLRVILRDYLRAGPRRVLGTEMRADDHDTLAAIAKLTLPVLVIRGGDDRVVSSAENQRLLHAVPYAVSREIAHGPHAVHWSYPRQLTAIIDAFLASVAPSSSDGAQD
jgi:2-hydroxy-6-oxonona-2,4-dienedioate hydrolase